MGYHHVAALLVAGIEELQRGQLKELDCRQVEMKGGEKLTREWVPTFLFTQMLSADTVSSLLLMSLPSPHPPP